MNLRISLGGDIIQYLGAVGLLKALQEFEGSESNNDFFEIHCCGFSCVPAVLWQYDTNTAYMRISKMWQEALKIFKSVSNPSLSGIVSNITLLYNVQKKIKNQEEDTKGNAKLREFVQKWVPEFEIDDNFKVKVHAFNMVQKEEEILTGNSIDVISRALAYPIDFSPIDDYLSLAWVFGIPEGDGIIYIDWLNSFIPQRASDYLLLSTFSRTAKFIKDRSDKAKFSTSIQVFDSKNLSVISNRFYLAGKKMVESLTV